MFFCQLKPNFNDIFCGQVNRLSCDEQGCQMVCFQTKNPSLGKLWRALDWKMFIYFMAIWNFLWRFGIFNDHFVFIWYIFSGFGIMYQEKSGNPGDEHTNVSVTSTCFSGTAWSVVAAVLRQRHRIISSGQPVN
jgi:hypothetical protein